MEICKQCLAEFEVSAEDERFLEKLSPKIGGRVFDLPHPTLCPECRQMRRMAFRNEKNFYKRKCDFSGKSILTMYSPKKDFKVYDAGIWWGDEWDALDYGRDYDFSRGFFEQFNELVHTVPRPAVYLKNSVNCDYCNHVENAKNCYLAVDTVGEDIYYSDWCLNGRNLVDCCYMYESEFCCECQFCRRCYDCVYVVDCEDCRDSRFLYDCRGCSNCFMCVGLRNKQYCFKNRQLSKEEYLEKMGKIDLGSYEIFKDWRKKFFDEFLSDFPRRYAKIINCENCVGDVIYFSKNVYRGFNVTECEDLRYCHDVFKVKDSMDTYQAAFGCELLYEQHASNHNVRCVACSISYYDSDCYYCDLVYHCSNCFGCVGLRHREYCIFNKQYSREEYEKLVPKIVEAMRERGEWGEFFPMENSYFDYKESVANLHYPQGLEEVKEGCSGDDFIDNITDAGDEVCEKVFCCELSGKKFKIIEPELRMYRKLGIALPIRWHGQRYKDRMVLRNPRKLWKRKCDKCGVDLQSSFAPDRPEKVYCEECYLGEVY
ncbi:hypothetical protein KJ632_00165 [Patescibacteria group bacterium]|nr:hypothetical protein [Patescibacteria group bacterium]